MKDLRSMAYLFTGMYLIMKINAKQMHAHTHTHTHTV